MDRLSVFYSVLQNGTLIRPRRQGSLLDCSHACSAESDLCRSESMEAGSLEAGSGHEDSSHNILTLDALGFLYRSQVTLELSIHADTADM
jgi:hypothetical protein